MHTDTVALTLGVPDVSSLSIFTNLALNKDPPSFSNTSIFSILMNRMIPIHSLAVPH